MVYKADKLRLRKLLMDAISLLCKNGLPVQSAFRIEATIGITLSEDEVVLVSFREMVQPDGVTGPQPLSEDEASDEASSVLSHGDELDGDNTGKKDNTVEDRPSQAVRDDTRHESSAWCDTGDSAFVGNSGHVGNFDLKRRSSVAADNNDNPNFPPLDVDAFSYDNTSSRLRPSGSSVDRFNHNNASSLDVSGRRSRFEVQIKDEIIDDDDCTFVKMEDGGDGGDAVFDPLVADDSFMYQVYNETNMYNAVGNELSQITQDYVDDTPGGGLAPGSNQSWTASPRSSQAYRGGSGAIRGGGGGATRGGARQSLPDASRSQVLLPLFTFR